MDYENNYLLRANAVIVHYILSRQSEFQYIYWTASHLFFFFLTFKSTQVYPIKTYQKSKSPKCVECCTMGWVLFMNWDGGKKQFKPMKHLSGLDSRLSISESQHSEKWELGLLSCSGDTDKPNTFGSCCSEGEAFSHSDIAQQLAGSGSFLPLPQCSQHSNKDPGQGLKFRSRLKHMSRLMFVSCCKVCSSLLKTSPNVLFPLVLQNLLLFTTTSQT